METNTRVTALRYDDDAHVWHVETEDGQRREADAVLVATGQLNQPSYPAIDGADDFAGHTFHSARWDHGHTLAGKRVAVIGTGASAVQFVPEVATQAARLTVFQRSGNWFLPRRNRRYPAAYRWAIRHVPGLQAWRRLFLTGYLEVLTAWIRHPRTLGRVGALWSTLFMRSQLTDPEVRRKAWPDYTFGCKRILFSSHYLPALQRENVELVTDAVSGIEPGGVRTADGRLHEVDTIIWGTGFRTNDFMFPMEITGRDGRTLAQEWASGAHAHLGMTVPGFPSLFVLYGPNTNTSGGSIIVFLEAQAAYVRQALQETARRQARAVEVRADVESAADAHMQEAFTDTAWLACDSWYRQPDGRIVANWPRYMEQYVRATRTLDPREYEFHR